MVQKLTELGVDTIIPLGASRSVVNWSADRCHRHHERFVRVAREAAMQSRRVWLPTIAPPTTVGTLVTTTAVSLAEPGGTASLSLDGSAVLVGPEGGWDDGELALSTTWVDLGPSILRAETAAVAVAALLAAMRANLVRPA